MSDLVGTVPQVAKRLECSESKIRELIKSGRLPHIKLGDQKIVVPWLALERWLDAELAEQAREAAG
jgi:excisionase family DNA binding protein